MKYIGSKNRISKYLLPIILKDRQKDQYYVEPFVGGANMIDKVDGNRIGNDYNSYLIELLKALQNGWIPPKNISEDEYNLIKNNKEKYDPHLVGYVGFNLTFGAKWFGGYGRDKQCNRKYDHESYRNVIKQIPYLNGIKFLNINYTDMIIPDNSIIYCDPPYANTLSYKDKINHVEFWEWCRNKTKEGHKVFISEYNAPKDFICVWKKEVNNSLSNSKKPIEKLFIHRRMIYTCDQFNSLNLDK